MDSEKNFFTRLRALAVKAEKQTLHYKEECDKAARESVSDELSGACLNRALKELQDEARSLKNTAEGQLKRVEEMGSFRDVLTACDNFLRKREQQALILKAHLVQYGYQPLPQPKPAKRDASEDKENEDMQVDSLTEEDTAKSEPVSDQGAGSPLREAAAATKADSDRTPKEEDFGLCMSRINLLLRKDAQQPTPEVEAKGAIPKRSRSPVCESTVVGRLSDGQLNWEDSTSYFGNRVNQASPALIASIHPAQGATTEQRPESCEPKSPNLTSWFLQDQNIPPAQPVMSLRQQEETVTPPSPDCQTTQLVHAMPQEPRRLVDAMDKPSPVEPPECYPRNENPTLEQPTFSTDAGYHLAKHPIATPSHKKGPAFLQVDSTPQTPELTMSISNFGARPKPWAIVPPATESGNVNYKPYCAATSSSVTTQPSVDATPHDDSVPQRTYQVIAPITREEHQSLSDNLRKVTLEQINEWVWLLDQYLASKPLDQRYLSPSDISRLQPAYPWLRATLLYLVRYHRLETVQQENGGIHYIPFMRRKLDFS